MTELDDLRNKVKEKRKYNQEELEKQKLKAELEEGTLKGVTKKIGKGLIKKFLK